MKGNRDLPLVLFIQLGALPPFAGLGHKLPPLACGAVNKHKLSLIFLVPCSGSGRSTNFAIHSGLWVLSYRVLVLLDLRVALLSQDLRRVHQFLKIIQLSKCVLSSSPLLLCCLLDSLFRAAGFLGAYREGWREKQGLSKWSRELVTARFTMFRWTRVFSNLPRLLPRPSFNSLIWINLFFRGALSSFIKYGSTLRRLNLLIMKSPIYRPFWKQLATWGTKPGCSTRNFTKLCGL